MSDVDDNKDIKIARLRELVKSLADELESAIEAQYDRVKNYPSMKRGYDRDMATVRQPKLRARRPEFMATAQTMTATTPPEPRRLFAD